MLRFLPAQWRTATHPATETLARDIPAWAISFTLHVVLLVVISLLTFTVPNPFQLTLSVPDVPPWELTAEQFHFSDVPYEEVGALSEDGTDTALAAAPELNMLEDIQQQPEYDMLDQGDLQFVKDVELATTPLNTATELVRGVAGVGVTGADGAIDRLTSEILLSLEDNDTLVVWLFDQSASLANQRDVINTRLGRIYDELGLIHDNSLAPDSREHPLLTAVLAFGEGHHWMIRKPTADVQEIQKAVATVSLDPTGVENVFTAVYAAAQEFERWHNKRNTMLIVVTDEVGEDHKSMLEPAVDVCRKHAMPVYVLGVPAAFGRSETMLKWVDPDPQYDQAVRWGRVNQGPESFLPELLHLPFAGEPTEAMDSGFGPFALTRLCVQTGGIYFTIHPNRHVGRRVSQQETDTYTSHLAYFFDPQRLRPYQPEYVSPAEYARRAQANQARSSVLAAANMTINRLEQPRTRFVKREEAQFANELTESQKSAAKLEPKLNAVYEVLQRGEEDRRAEDSLRWQAAYDLAYGQSLAVLVRTRAYNEMLASAKRGLTPQTATNNTWQLQPSEDLSISSRLERNAKQAQEHLQRVVNDHAGTPWALIAQRELDMPMGWKWQESFTPVQDANMQPGNGNNNNARPRDDQPRVIPKKPPQRNIPKL